jgi:lycopene cyclase domain-containing protein
MSYTTLALIGAVTAIIFDLYLMRTRLLASKRFWASYAIIIFFQLLTNWWLTSREIVIYSESAIIGWRIASAPVEDLLFGFALIVAALSRWERLKER